MRRDTLKGIELIEFFDASFDVRTGRIRWYEDRAAAAGHGGTGGPVPDEPETLGLAPTTRTWLEEGRDGHREVRW